MDAALLAGAAHLRGHGDLRPELVPRGFGGAGMRNRLTRRDLNHRFDEIVDFEQQITDDGYVLVKFFFHISKKEQKKRLKCWTIRNRPAGA